MPQQNGRLNSDLGGIVTTAYNDGDKWYIFVKSKDGDNATIGSIYDTLSDNTVVGLLKGLKAQLPSQLQGGFLKAQIMGALPIGTNNIGKVDVAVLPALSMGTNKIGKVDIDKLVINPDGSINTNNSGTQNVNIENANEQFFTGSGSKYGAYTVPIIASPVRIGASDLADRHTLLLVNTSQVTIYYGYDANVTISNGIPILAGSEREIKLNPADPLTIYSVAEAEAVVRISESN
jgi:hypothetical protein